MKLIPLLAFIAGLLATVHGAFADWQENFSVPPYTLDATIIDVNGWKRTNASTALEDAVVLQPAWNPTPMLRMRKSETSTQNRIYNDSFDPFTGKVRLTIEMAFNFSLDNTTTSVTLGFTDPGAQASPVRIGMRFEAEGGIFVTTNEKNTILYDNVILAKANVREDSIYTFVLDIDLENKTLDITVTGLDADGNPFSFTGTSITTGSFSQNRISAVHLYSNSRAVNELYVNSIQIATIPEPGVASLFYGASILAGMGWILKQKH